MPPPAIHDALSAWRVAERQWEATDPRDRGYRAASMEVVSAWLTYHEATASEPDSFVLIADDEHRYVAVSGNVTDVLGYAPEELVGQKIENVVAPDAGTDPFEDWQRFLNDGRQVGQYSMLDRDGHVVRLSYEARAHHPIPGYHLSRLRPTE